MASTSDYGSGNGVFYVCWPASALDDQLHSTTAIVDATGALQAQQYYYPYGANRGGAQSDLTDKRFTGQYHEGGLAGAEGLYYYDARRLALAGGQCLANRRSRFAMNRRWAGLCRRMLLCPSRAIRRR